MESQFKNENLDVEFFNGCDGSKYGISGTLGCAYSHSWIWNDIIKKGYENVLILEDDAILKEGFKNKLISLRAPEEWDILYLSRMGTIFENETDGDFTRCKCLGTAGYILNVNSAKKIAYLDPADMKNTEIDLVLLKIPLKTWGVNDLMIDVPTSGQGDSVIGFRITSDLDFYIHSIKYLPTLEIIFVLLLFFTIRKLFQP